MNLFQHSITLVHPGALATASPGPLTVFRVILTRILALLVLVLIGVIGAAITRRDRWSLGLVLLVAFAMAIVTVLLLANIAPGVEG